MGTALQQSGYKPEKEDICRLKVKFLHKSAQQPVKGRIDAAGFDIHSVLTTSKRPHT